MTNTKDKLEKINSREEGFEFLKNYKVKDLVSLAKSLDLMTRGTKQQLKERIVHFTIGYRLNSQAIQEA